MTRHAQRETRLGTNERTAIPPPRLLPWVAAPSSPVLSHPILCQSLSQIGSLRDAQSNYRAFLFFPGTFHPHGWWWTENRGEERQKSTLLFDMRSVRRRIVTSLMTSVPQADCAHYGSRALLCLPARSWQENLALTRRENNYLIRRLLFLRKNDRSQRVEKCPRRRRWAQNRTRLDP